MQNAEQRDGDRSCRCAAAPSLPPHSTHHYPCVVRSRTVWPHSFHASFLNGLSPVFCPAGPKSKPSSRRAKLATPIAKPLAAPVRMTPCPTRWFRDPLDNAIKKLVLGGSHGLARSSQNRSPALWGRVERAGEASWCWVHAMGSYLRARGASAIHGYPVCPTGRREQRVLSGVKDGRLHRNWINRSMSA